VVESLELLTERLRLRTPQIEDADATQSIVADPRVALTTASIPHPYPKDGAKDFILHVRNMANRDRRNLAIVLRDAQRIDRDGRISDQGPVACDYEPNLSRAGLWANRDRHRSDASPRR
jgi:RimJ/RimL family protein N-acetyltransferase